MAAEKRLDTNDDDLDTNAPLNSDQSTKINTEMKKKLRNKKLPLPSSSLPVLKSSVHNWVMRFSNYDLCNQDPERIQHEAKLAFYRATIQGALMDQKQAQKEYDCLRWKQYISKYARHDMWYHAMEDHWDVSLDTLFTKHSVTHLVKLHKQYGDNTVWRVASIEWGTPESEEAKNIKEIGMMLWNLWPDDQFEYGGPAVNDNNNNEHADISLPALIVRLKPI